VQLQRVLGTQNSVSKKKK